jgi:phage tail-like protein
VSNIAPTARNPISGNSPDALPELRFMVTIGSSPEGIIGRFSECSGLSVEYEILEYQEGGQNNYIHKLRGRAKFPNITLKRGMTKEDALMKWFKDCSDKADRKDLTIRLLSPMGKGEPIRTWSFEGAYPVKWTGPNLNAGSNNLATETLEIAHRGFSAGA